jgi:probable rRNA maturation factor
MNKIDVVNKTRKRISEVLVRKVARKTMATSLREPRNFWLTVVFVGKKEIWKLNQIYRRKNKSTDVLSFDYSSGYNKIGGELFLCPEVIEKSARSHKVSFQKELAFVLSHGMLHLLGMKHGRKMYKIQDEIAKNM